MSGTIKKFRSRQLNEAPRSYESTILSLILTSITLTIVTITIVTIPVVRDIMIVVILAVTWP